MFLFKLILIINKKSVRFYITINPALLFILPQKVMSDNSISRPAEFIQTNITGTFEFLKTM